MTARARTSRTALTARPARPVTPARAAHGRARRQVSPAPGGVAHRGAAAGRDRSRQPPHRARKRAHPWKAAFFVLAVVAIIAGVTWALLGSKFLVVRSSHGHRGAGHPRSQVITAAGHRAGTPLIRISTADRGPPGGAAHAGRSPPG